MDEPYLQHKYNINSTRTRRIGSRKPSQSLRTKKQGGRGQKKARLSQAHHHMLWTGRSAAQQLSANATM
ncbi:predicted protein [Plenodomus lingam JN3]|uniref:Predicted protein n=1 Tax=Leptosphaeria maculans (strain JN3 / isolate v23.1.3 / race Av1-4-5-6-7-8) TaxID=985895 RepID=E5ABZ7_LEPMJ|nr:predicted protein [Plenodomus lingam JN3]CBY01188.1 predicted protein [Plenodomus lingam JN3]